MSNGALLLYFSVKCMDWSMNTRGMLWVKLVDPSFPILFLTLVSWVCGWFPPITNQHLFFAERNYFIPNWVVTPELRQTVDLQVDERNLSFCFWIRYKVIVVVLSALMVDCAGAIMGKELLYGSYVHPFDPCFDYLLIS